MAKIFVLQHRHKAHYLSDYMQTAKSYLFVDNAAEALQFDDETEANFVRQFIRRVNENPDNWQVVEFEE